MTWLSAASTYMEGTKWLETCWRETKIPDKRAQFELKTNKKISTDGLLQKILPGEGCYPLELIV